jgi:diketogulonate reductase-like aldo/keto reductase
MRYKLFGRQTGLRVSEFALGAGMFIGSRRDELVIATKYTFGSTADGGLLSTGNSRKNMVQSVEASLKRLGTDRIDLYWVHTRRLLGNRRRAARSLAQI